MKSFITHEEQVLKQVEEWNKDIKEEFIIPRKQTKIKQPLNIKFSNFKIK